MWTLRSRIIWHRSQKRRILCGRSATTSRGVLEAYSSQKPQSATVRLSMWKGAPNNAEGKAKQCIGVMMSFCSILLRFLNRTFQNVEIRCSVWKQTEAHWSVAAAKRMNWKWSSVRVTANLAIWKGYQCLHCRLARHECKSFWHNKNLIYKSNLLASQSLCMYMCTCSLFMCTTLHSLKYQN